MTYQRARRRRLSSTSFGSSSSPSSSTEPDDLAIVSSSSRSLSQDITARQRAVVVMMEEMSHQEDNNMISGGVWKEQGDEGSDTNISTTEDSSHNEQEENSTQIDVDDEDDDSLSCASSSSSDSSTDSDYYDAEPEDLKFRLTSSLFFLVGASIQTVTASWDVRDARMDAATAIAMSSTDDFTTGSSEDDPVDAMDRLYRILYSLGPFLFVLNALVEMLHSLTLPNNHQHNNDNNNSQGYYYILRKGCLQWTTNMTSTATRRIPCTTCCTDNPAYEPTAAQVVLEEEADLDIDNDHHHHRRHHDAIVEDKLSDFVAAAFFGIGAMLELYGTFVEYDVDTTTTAPANNNFWTSYRVNIVSMHTYLISGLLTVHKERRLLCFPSSGNDNHYGRRRRSSSMVRIVMGLGIMLFILGSIVDCVMSYLYDPLLVTENMISPFTLTFCNLSSTILWNVDAICYVIVDCLIFEVTAKCSLWMRQLRPTQCQQRQRQRHRTAPTGTSATASPSPPRHVELTTHLAMPLLLVGGGTAAAATIDTVSSPAINKMELQQQQEHQLSSQKVV